MTWPRHVLLSFGGPLHDTEQWSCGLRLNPPGALASNPFHDEIEAGLADLAGDISTWWTQNTVIQSIAAKLEQVKLNVIGVDGRYEDATTSHTHWFTGTLPATSYAAIYPGQVSLVASLTTDADRGLASRGRIYLPSPKLAINSTYGTIEAADAISVANRVAVLINSINDWPGWDAVTEWAGMRVQVVSSVGAGAMRPVTGVRVGRVLDTQRRRRKSLLEQYQTNTTAIVG